MDNLAKYIDHTNLKPNATKRDIALLIKEAQQYGFASVCINPYWVKFATEKLRNTAIHVCTVIGFPLGAATVQTKSYQAREAITNGADELDMVINIGALKSGLHQEVENEIRSIVQLAQHKTIVKSIIETCLLTNEEKVEACRLAVRSGADYVKTSTGFSTGGATVEDIALLRETVGNEIGVKAAGGIHSKKEAEAMIEAGATRIGTSAGVKIMLGL